MGYVTTANSKEGTPLKIRIRNKLVDAKVVKIPFYKN
jgi:glycine cleavage system aminomethyltransferase T